MNIILANFCSNDLNVVRFIIKEFRSFFGNCRDSVSDLCIIADHTQPCLLYTSANDVTGSANFDGSANVSISAALKNVGTPGTYSVVTTDAKGRVTAGGQIVEVGSAGQTTPSANLAVGGLFFKEV